jgi:hypothetical protein
VIGVLVLIAVVPPKPRDTRRFDNRIRLATPGEVVPPPPGLLKKVQVPCAYVAPEQPDIVEH